MSDRDGSLLKASPEQIRYAALLRTGMLLGLLTLLVTFALYAFGIMSPYIPLEEVSSKWGVGVNEYLDDTKVEAGWAWIGMLQYGDFVNFVGVTALAGITIFCYAAIVPVLLKNGDRAYAIMAVAEVVILSLAASGLLAAGH